MIPYQDYSYLYPPRPEKAISPETVGFYENLKWLAQVKRNGDCTMIFARKGDVRAMNRHNEVPSRWSLSEEQKEFFGRDKNWSVFAAERVGDKLYIFDTVVKDGTQLVGTTFESRQNHLYDRWPIIREDQDEVFVSETISVAKSYRSDFATVFSRLGPKDEGLVMKDPDVRLMPCFRDKQNGSWQVKARIQTKNYSF